jgi:gas vesicle protein
MGDTIEAIGYKTDVKSRAKESVSERTGAVKEKVGGAAGTAQQNPLGLAIGAVAVGFVAGMLIPSTSVEDRKIGPVADQLKDRAKETGQDALEHGKQVAQDVAESAQETVKESGQQHAQELASSAPASS